jgi:peptidoglycan/LPS O-acetylase OafA/YrhL
MPFSYGTGSGLPDWANGAYELFALMVALPLILLAGVGCGTDCLGRLSRPAAFLAELSYPLYMTHYPFVEIHNWWVQTYSMNMSAGACVALSAAEFAMYLIVAFASMRLCDRILAKVKGYGK